MSGICQADADASYRAKKEAQMDKMGDTAPKVLNVMTQMLGVVGSEKQKRKAVLAALPTFDRCSKVSCDGLRVREVMATSAPATDEAD